MTMNHSLTHAAAGDVNVTDEETDVQADQVETLEVEAEETDVQADQVETLEVEAEETDVQADQVETLEVEAEETDEEIDETTDDATGASRPGRLQRLEHEGDIAADYLEELLDIADLDGDLDMDVDGDRAAVSIVGADLSQLVGTRGEVLDALQELSRLAVYRETGERSRLMLDIGGYRAEKKETLEKLAAATVAQVKETGEPVSLEPMSPFERKVVHDVVAAAGLTSESAGVEPRRYVVVQPS